MWFCRKSISWLPYWNFIGIIYTHEYQYLLQGGISYGTIIDAFLRTKGRFVFIVARYIILEETQKPEKHAFVSMAKKSFFIGCMMPPIPHFERRNRMKRIFYCMIALIFLFVQSALAEPVAKKSITIDIIGGQLNGQYTGEIDENGLPDGYGVFDTESSGVKYKMIGEWKNGHQLGVVLCQDLAQTKVR